MDTLTEITSIEPADPHREAWEQHQKKFPKNDPSQVEAWHRINNRLEARWRLRDRVDGRGLWYGAWIDSDGDYHQAQEYTHSDAVFQAFDDLATWDTEEDEKIDWVSEALKRGWVRVLLTRRKELDIEFTPGHLSPTAKRELIDLIRHLSDIVISYVIDFFNEDESRRGAQFSTAQEAIRVVNQS